jgi:hypothetical protein
VFTVKLLAGWTPALLSKVHARGDACRNIIAAFRGQIDTIFEESALGTHEDERAQQLITTRSTDFAWTFKRLRVDIATPATRAKVTDS